MLLINAVKDVASALGDLISATKYASGKPQKDPAMTTLMDSAKVRQSRLPLQTAPLAKVGLGLFASPFVAPLLLSFPSKG